MKAINNRQSGLLLTILITLGISMFAPGCGGSQGGGVIAPAAVSGTVSGTIFVGATPAQTVAAAGAVTAAPAAGAISNSQPKSTPNPNHFVPGEVIVQFKGGSALAPMINALQQQFPNDHLQPRTTIPLLHAVTFSSAISLLFDQKKVTREEAGRQTLDLIARIQADPDVQQASPNHLNRAKAIPNDPGYKEQWNYPAIALPQAWDITTGSPSVIVAVLDTGIFPHPDLYANVVAGYDFVSDPASAGDGNGIDADPTAVATAQNDGAHGTHVAGTIAAVSDNRKGVAGVSWQSKIMPVRVLGIRGGTEADLMNGIAYAAGLANASGTLPVQRANVINMSISGYGSSQFMQQTIDAAWNQGVTIVAAAGNSALSGNPVEYPCAYNHVICVGAVGPDFKRATYSDFNSFVDVVAPGGAQTLNPRDGVLSTIWKNGRAEYIWEQGTSMAAPHVAGVAALMLSVNAALTPLQIEQDLTSTATDLGVAGRDSNYGFGLINAYHAVSLAKNGTLPGAPALYATDKIYLDRTVASTTTSLLNVGGGTLSISSATTNAPWLTATLSGTGAPATLALSANGTGQSAALLTGSVTVSSSAGSKTMQVFFDNRPPVDPGTVIVELLDSIGNVVATTTTSKAQGFAYQFTNIPAGNYLVDAGIDRDGSGSIDNWGEYIGGYPLLDTPQWVTMTTGGNASAINFQLHKIDDLIQVDNNGRPPIRGAVLAQVKDAQGDPIVGAHVYIGDGVTAQGTTDALGRVVLYGSFSNAQTVTAAAPGYTTLTYWLNNNSFLGFQLDKITTAQVPLTVTLTGMTVGDSGILFAGSARGQTFTVTSASMTFTQNQDNNLPITISAMTYNSTGAAHQFGHKELPQGITNTTTVTLPLTTPTKWVGFSGNMAVPAGNFSQTGVTQRAIGMVYFGPYQPAYINGFQTITLPSNFSLEMALTNASIDPVASVIAVGVSNSSGESSLALRLGSLLPTAITALPSSAIITLPDVPAQITPSNGTTVASLTPTFSWSNTISPASENLNIVNPTTNQTIWEIDSSSNISTLTLPAIPSGGLKAATTYQWNVDNFSNIIFSPGNTNNSFGLSSSQTGTFSTP